MNLLYTNTLRVIPTTSSCKFVKPKSRIRLYYVLSSKLLVSGAIDAESC